MSLVRRKTRTFDFIRPLHAMVTVKKQCFVDIYGLSEENCPGEVQHDMIYSL